MKYANYAEEVMHALQSAKAADKVSGIQDLKKYIGTAYDFIGLSVPLQRAVFKKGFSFSKLPLPEQLQIWNELWLHSDNYEILSQCLYFTEYNRTRLDALQLWKVVRGWVKKIDNWAHSDGLSDVYAHLLECLPKEVYQQYVRWNHAANPWERRQSLVGMLLYSKKRVHLLPADQMLPLVANLLQDEHYFVQKGLGWTLREIGNVYPQEALDFLRRHVGDISSVAFTAAIEKLDPVQKDLLKQQRKARRRQ